MSRDIFVFIEQRDSELQKVGIEILGKARELADKLEQKVIAILLGSNIKSKAEVLIHYGADKVIFVDDKILEEYITEPYTKAIYEIIRKYDPEIVLYGATSIGRDLAPRLASRIHTGLTADCTALEIDEKTKNLLMTRPAFGGNLMATIICEDYRPQMVTVRPGVMKALDSDINSKGEIIEEKIQFNDLDINVVIKEVRKESTKKKDITEVPILVSGGRGLGSSSKFSMLQDLASLLSGEVSGSRAVVDAEWLPKDKQVGQTGKTVRPEVYFAFGISGAVQHLAGMEESGMVIAINKDEGAGIFRVSDLGIVGDLHLIVPKVIELIKKIKEQKKIR